jgi:hypothetical protein
MAGSVVDLRESTAADAVTRLQQLWHRRQETAAKLAERLPAVRARASQQLDEIVDCAREMETAGRVLSC